MGREVKARGSILFISGRYWCGGGCDGLEASNWAHRLVNGKAMNAMKGNQCIFIVLKHDVFGEMASRIQFADLLSSLARSRSSIM